jgi:hypothetical protein
VSAAVAASIVGIVRDRRFHRTANGSTSLALRRPTPETVIRRGAPRRLEIFDEAKGVVDGGVDVAAGDGVTDAEQLVVAVGVAEE